MDGDKLIEKFNSMIDELEENPDLELLEEEVDELIEELQDSEKNWELAIDDLNDFKRALEQKDSEEAQKQALEIKLRAKGIV